MNNILNVFGHDKTTEVLLLSWAEKHPYLFTAIEITNSTTIYIIIAVAGFKAVSSIFGGRKWRRNY
jgi:ABC-type lipoprotein release transport system permease subunit